MPESFTAAFAARLNEVCPLEVKEACDGDRVVPGRCLIAPGGRHMVVRGRGNGMKVSVRGGPPVNFHRPSVDVLFHSIADCVAKNAVGVILTGMGSDGARGLLAMREAGSHTIAQDRDSSIVFGMPRVAYELGATVEVSPLDRIGERVVHALVATDGEPHAGAVGKLEVAP